MPAGTPQRHRIIWAFGLGYFAFYIPYSALIKLVITGSFGEKLSGVALLPGTIAGTLLATPLLVTLLGWWKYASFARKLPLERPVIVSGIATAVIIATTTLAYGFEGVSIVLTLLLLRGGVLILSPIVDLAGRRHVRWFSWVALVLSISAIAVVLSDMNSVLVPIAAALNIGVYLIGYTFRLPMMTKCAKREDVEHTRRYFVDELLVALAVLALIPLLFVLAGSTAVWTSSALVPALTIGALYSCLYIFGTLIYLDRRENTFCVPLNRASSLLAGVVAAWMLSSVWGFDPVGDAQLAGATIVMLALLFLSPAHHLDEYLRHAAARRRPPAPAVPELPAVPASEAPAASTEPVP